MRNLSRLYYLLFSARFAILYFYSEVAKGLMKYQPDIIISVHPLMQHVPLRILRAKGLLKKIVFTTVVTDLSTCHPTWYFCTLNVPLKMYHK